VADYNANIKVNADTRSAEQAIKRLTSQLDNIQNTFSAAQGIKNIGEAFVPGKVLKGLEREIDNVIQRGNTLEKVFARLVEGVSVAQITSGGLGALNDYLKQISINAQQTQDTFANIPQVIKTIVPGLRPASDATNLISKSIGTIEFKLQSLLNSTEGIRNFVNSIGTLEGVSGAAAVSLTALAAVVEGQLSEALSDIDINASKALKQLAEDAAAGTSELQRLIRATQGTVEQYENLLAKGQQRLKSVNAESDEARRAANTITQAQKLLNEELEKQNDLLREARGLTQTGLEERKAVKSLETKRRRETYLSDVKTGVQSALEAAAALDAEIENLNQSLVDADTEIAEKRWQALTAGWKEADEAAEKLAKQLKELRSLQAERSFKARGNRDPVAFDSGGVVRRTISGTTGEFFGPGGAPLPRDRASAVDAEAAVRREFGLRQEYAKRIAFIEAEFDKKANFRELEFIQKELNAELDKIDIISERQKQANKESLDDFDRRLKARTEAQTKAASASKQRNEKLANITLGAGFPLLFGGGPGAVIGGGLGGALGTGPQALAAQIGLSALGQIFDQFGASAAELSAALNPLTLDVEKLIPALGATNTETAQYLRKLDELGRQDEALAVATEELAKIVGFDGVRALRDYGDAVVSLSNEWSKLITQLQAGLAKLLEGPVRSVATRLERANVLSQARESTDPRIQLLFAQRRNASFSDLEGIDTQIITLQKEINQAAEKRAALEQQKSVSFDQQVRLLTAQTELAALGNDLTNQAVFNQQKLVIQKQKELEIAEAQGNAEKIAIADARERLSLQQLRSDRLEAQLAAEERLTKEFERQRKEIEKIEKQRSKQLGEAQTGFVLSGLELQVQATTGDDKAKRIAEFDLERAKRIAQYTEKIKEALSEEERRFILAAQENDIYASQLRLQEDLYQIDLKRSELLNSEDPLGRANEEIALLQAKIKGTEKEYLLQKQISDLADKPGVTRDVAEATALTIRDLEAQNKAIQAQKQLWKDIYTSITGNITSAVEGLIAGTQTWGELLSNILGSLGTLFLNQGFNALGTSLGLTGFAEGGFVTGPTRALIGEGGESEYVIPASKMKSAMNRYAAGARGNAVLSGGDETSGGGTATMAPAAIDVRYNVERINNVDYVTNQEFQAGLQQAASQGAERGQQLALRRLQQSVTTRRRLGI